MNDSDMKFVKVMAANGETWFVPIGSILAISRASNGSWWIRVRAPGVIQFQITENNGRELVRRLCK